MNKLKEIALWFKNFGIDLYIVGGACRDEIMGLPIEDVDVCIVGGLSPITIKSLFEQLLEENLINNYTSVHGSFPIWIVEIDGEKYEFAMARKERKVGQSRQEFECEVNNVSIEEDLERRDLTINAIAKNIVTGEIVDPFGGVLDIKDKVARPVSEAFKEDALRIYRSARFIARFDLYPSPFLIHFSTELKPDSISNERVGMELMKMFKTASKPSRFFNFLKRIGWLKYHFPELHATIGIPQNPIHHPEGDVFTHTMHCIDAVPKGDVFQRAIMLCHDLGKVSTTEVDGIKYNELKNALIDEDISDSKITAHGHEEAGVEPTKNMLKRISFASHEVIDQIACLVELHMIRIVISKDNYDKIIRRTLRKLMKYNLGYHDLMNVINYDLMGRPPKVHPSPSELFEQLYRAHSIELVRTNAMEPIVTGKLLLSLGMEAGEEIGKIIKHALELQDRGTLNKDNWQKVLKGAGYKFFQTKKEIK